MTSKTKKVYEMEIPSIPDKIRKVVQLAEKVAHKCGFKQNEKDDLAIAVTEAVNNAIHHGNKADKNKIVKIRFEAESRNLTVRVKDEGEGFDPKQLRDPIQPENLLRDSGRGIFILRTLMDKVSFSFSDEGTEIVMIKKT